MGTILGIDEAGRGPVVGPMAIAGVVLDEKDLDKLVSLKVRDSKLILPKVRERMELEIKSLAKDYIVLKVSAREIDEMRKRKNLNLIEAEKIAQILRAMKADKAYVDAPQVSTEKFKDILIALSKTKTKIISENKADLKYPIVGAASILAKVERDREIERIKKIVGEDFGVGYPHDERTIEFVRKCLDTRKHLEFIRHSWVTVSMIKKEKLQKSLGEY